MANTAGSWEALRVMLEIIERLIVTALYGPMWVGFHVVKYVYPYLFGSFERRAEEARDNALEFEVGLALSFLFEEHGCHVVREGGIARRRGFDYAEVIIEFEGCRLFIFRCRGDLDVMASPEFAPLDWVDLRAISKVCAKAADIEPPAASQGFDDLWSLARYLKQNIGCVTSWLGRGRFDELKERIGAAEHW